MRTHLKRCFWLPTPYGSLLVIRMSFCLNEGPVGQNGSVLVFGVVLMLQSFMQKM